MRGCGGILYARVSVCVFSERWVSFACVRRFDCVLCEKRIRRHHTSCCVFSARLSKSVNVAETHLKHLNLGCRVLLPTSSNGRYVMCYWDHEPLCSTFCVCLPRKVDSTSMLHEDFISWVGLFSSSFTDNTTFEMGFAARMLTARTDRKNMNNLCGWT